jgi:hypothetical protein
LGFVGNPNQGPGLSGGLSNGNGGAGGSSSGAGSNNQNEQQQEAAAAQQQNNSPATLTQPASTAKSPSSVKGYTGPGADYYTTTTGIVGVSGGGPPPPNAKGSATNPARVKSVSNPGGGQTVSGGSNNPSSTFSTTSGIGSSTTSSTATTTTSPQVSALAAQLGFAPGSVTSITPTATGTLIVKFTNGNTETFTQSGQPVAFNNANLTGSLATATKSAAAAGLFGAPSGITFGSASPSLNKLDYAAFGQEATILYNAQAGTYSVIVPVNGPGNPSTTFVVPAESNSGTINAQDAAVDQAYGAYIGLAPGTLGGNGAPSVINLVTGQITGPQLTASEVNNLSNSGILANGYANAFEPEATVTLNGVTYTGLQLQNLAQEFTGQGYPTLPASLQPGLSPANTEALYFAALNSNDLAPNAITTIQGQQYTVQQLQQIAGELGAQKVPLTQPGVNNLPGSGGSPEYGAILNSIAQKGSYSTNVGLYTYTITQDPNTGSLITNVNFNPNVTIQAGSNISLPQKNGTLIQISNPGTTPIKLSEAPAYEVITISPQSETVPNGPLAVAPGYIIENSGETAQSLKIPISLFQTQLASELESSNVSQQPLSYQNGLYTKPTTAPESQIPQVTTIDLGSGQPVVISGPTSTQSPPAQSDLSAEQFAENYLKAAYSDIAKQAQYLATQAIITPIGTPVTQAELDYGKPVNPQAYNVTSLKNNQSR